MKIYLASSWRNPHHPYYVQTLRKWGHEVHDYRNPPDGTNGFKWEQAGLNTDTCSLDEMRSTIQEHPRAKQGYQSDFAGMVWANVGILLMPSGKSAHLEMGWMAGADKKTVIHYPYNRRDLMSAHGVEPELMTNLLDDMTFGEEELWVLLDDWRAKTGKSY